MFSTFVWSHLSAIARPPNGNWITEEVATWLLLGSIPGLTIGHFSLADVPISSGYLYEPQESRVVAHYSSGAEAAFFERYWRW